MNPVVRSSPHRGRLPAGESSPAGESLIVLKENRFAHAAVGRLARRKSGDPVWLVYLYGPSGVGKSHFVRHFIREARRHTPRLRLQITAASDFAVRLNASALRRALAEFQATYTGVDLLILEDLAALQGRPSAQRMLIGVLDELKRTGGRVVVTCSTLPGRLKNITPRLASRLRGGVCVPIELLDEDSRRRFVSHLAAHRQIPLSAPAADALAKDALPTPRELLSALLHVDLGANRKGLAGNAGGVRAKPKGAENANGCSLQRIAKEVAGLYHLSPAELRSSTRKKRTQRARQIAMLLARELSGRPAGSIAQFFGRKNHTTVVHACRRTRALLDRDEALAREVNRLRHLLGRT